MESTQTETSPSEAQIKQTISQLRLKLKNDNVNLPMNKPVREGLNEAVRLLVEDVRTYEGIGEIDSRQGRAIAVLAVDFLNGECSAEVLLRVPIKQR